MRNRAIKPFLQQLQPKNLRTVNKCTEVYLKKENTVPVQRFAP